MFPFSKIINVDPSLHLFSLSIITFIYFYVDNLTPLISFGFRTNVKLDFYILNGLEQFI